LPVALLLPVSCRQVFIAAMLWLMIICFFLLEEFEASLPTLEKLLFSGRRTENGVYMAKSRPLI
jgi:hypothetical protein